MNKMNSTDLLKIVDKYIFVILIIIFGFFVKLFSSSKKPKKIEKILIIKLWAIGDSILTLPLISQIRKKYPRAQIDILSHKNNMIVYQNQKFIDNRINLTFLNCFKLFKKYDVCIDTEPFMNQSAIISCYVSKKRIGFNHGIRKILYTNTIKFDKTKHMVEMYFDMGKIIDVIQDKSKKLIELKYSKSAEDKVNDILAKNKISKQDKLICFNPSVGASVKEREWPKENFKSLAEKILKSNKTTKIILVGIKSDYELNEYIRNKNKNILNFSGKLNLEELFCFIKKTNLVISNDTGTMHISAAQGIKTIGLFGPNTPVIWAPYGEKNISLFHPKRGCPYLDNTKHNLVSKHLTEEQKTCMNAIKVEEVFQHI